MFYVLMFCKDVKYGNKNNIIECCFRFNFLRVYIINLLMIIVIEECFVENIIV